MADITAKFSMVDEMSAYLSEIANNGMAIVYSFEDMESSLNSTFDSIESSASTLANSLEDLNFDVDTSGLDNLDDAIDSSIGSADDLSSALSGFEAEVEYSEIENLNDELDDVAENAGDAEKSVTDAMTGIYTVLSTLGVAKLVSDIADALIDMTNNASESQSTVVKATGATGDTLSSLMESFWNVYGTSLTGSYESISGVIGEVNTRLGYTGEQLEETSSKFLEFSQATGVDAVTAVQDVTQVMNLWGIEADKMESTMDKIVYYGQVSGGSVSDLMTTLENGAAVFQNAGLSFDATVGLLAELELYGINSTTALTGFRNAINKISEEGGDVETELGNIITKIAECDTQSEATAIAVEYFGSRAGQQLALAIREGAISVESFTGDLSDAEGTLSTTAEYAQTLSEKWDQAGRSIEAAFAPSLTPIIEGVSGAFADFVINIGEFLQDSPEAVAIITGIGVAFGTVVVAFSGMALFQNVIAPMFETILGAASAAALPIAAVAAAIGLVTTAVMIFSDTSRDLNPDGTSYDQLIADADAAIQRAETFVEEYETTMESLEGAEIGDLALIDRIAELAAQEELSNAEMMEMQSLIQRLNADIPGLGMTYEDLTGNVEDYTAAIRAQIEAEYDRQKQQEQQEAYAEAYLRSIELTGEMEYIQSQLDAAKEKYNYHEVGSGVTIGGEEQMIGKVTGDWGYEVTLGAGIDSSHIKDYQEKLVELQAELDEVNAIIAEIEGSWNETAEDATEGADEVTQATEAVKSVTEEYYDQIVALEQAYQDAYDAAKDSFDGQFGLFDEAKANAEATVSAAQSALDSQLAYWTNYAANMEILKDWQPSEDMGVTQEDVDALMAYVQSGSEDAAGLAQSMVDAITSGDESAVADLANTLAEVESAKESAAETVAEWQTGFDEQMQSIIDSMNTSLNQIMSDMEISDETYAMAQNAIQQYANGILSMKGQVVDAATQIASAAQQAIASISLSAPVAGHASGTTNAEDIFLAGEEGPELIVGRGGSTVFPTSETNRILSAINSSGGGAYGEGLASGYSGSGNDKTINLNINGTGMLAVRHDGSMSKEDIVDVLVDNLKDALIAIIQEEILTEGDGVYEY